MARKTARGPTNEAVLKVLFHARTSLTAREINTAISQDVELKMSGVKAVLGCLFRLSCSEGDDDPPFVVQSGANADKWRITPAGEAAFGELN